LASSNFSFLVGGHLYGSSKLANTYPGATLLSSIDSINNTQASFLISLGDLFQNIKKDIPNYQKSLLTKLKMPIYNSVGNHDIDYAGTYFKQFGSTYFSWQFKGCLFIVLDTELANGSITKEQLAFFKSALNQAKHNFVHSIFIASHRPVWTQSDDQFQNIFKGNTSAIFKNNYKTEILPLLINLDKPIYWLSGSLGTAKSPFFYHQQAPNLYYIQTAIRDWTNDGILKVNIQEKEILFNTISLTGQQLSPLQDYNLSYWEKDSSRAPEWNYKMQIYQIKVMVLHRFFWYGVSMGLFLFFSLNWIFLKKGFGNSK